MTGSGESPSSPRRIGQAEKRRDALELRKGGATFEQIAQTLGYADRGSACNAIKRELVALPRPDAQALLALELARLDDLHAALWPGALKGDVDCSREIRGLMQLRYTWLKLERIDHGVEEGKSLIRDIMDGLKHLAGAMPEDDDDPDDDPAPTGEDTPDAQT